MEKTLAILERNVQWFALGLGVIFLAWVAYAYVVTPPAQVQIPGAGVVGPGQVAMATSSGPVRKFEQENSRKDAPDFATPDIVSSWRGQMNRPFGSPIGAYVFDGLTSGGIVPRDQNLTPDNNIHLAALPVLPEARPVGVAAGLSVINQPAKPVNPNVRQPVAVAATQHDLLWDVTAFKIPADALARAFAAPLNGRPSPGPEIYNTTLLQVVLERQRATGVDANGQPVFPDEDKVTPDTVPALSIYKSELQSLPSEADPTAKKYEYLDWAQKNPDLIGRPAFYEVVAGDPWNPPQDPATAAPGDAVAGNPAAGNAGAPDAAGATQPSEVPPAPASPPDSTTPTPKTPAPAPASSGNPFYAPEDRERAAAPPYYPPSRAAYEQSGRGSYGRGNPRFGRGLRGRMNPNQFNAPNQFNGGGGNGVIDPLNLQEDIEIWCHDETVKPGQTYRYRVIYKMKNPVFEIANMADPKSVNTLVLSSKPSKWTEPVKVPETTKFWLASLNDNSAHFDVFHWIHGAWTAKKNLPLVPGDLVPGTDWSLVDLRHGEGSRHSEYYALLTDDGGDMSRRSMAVDGGDPNHQTMLDDTNPNNGANSGQNVTPSPVAPSRRSPGRGIPSGRGGRAGYGR
jgi:hypothetical protein